jgi:hypothetical protein
VSDIWNHTYFPQCFPDDFRAATSTPETLKMIIGTLHDAHIDAQHRGIVALAQYGQPSWMA